MKQLKWIQMMKWMHSLRYELFKETYGVPSSKFTRNLYMIGSPILKFVMINVLMSIIDIFIIVGTIPLQWGIIAGVNLCILYYYLLASIIEGDNQKLKFLAYFKSGLFTQTEQACNVKQIVHYYTATFVWLISLVAVHLNIVTFHIQMWRLQELFVALAMEVLIVVCYFHGVSKKTYTQLQISCKRKNNRYSIVRFVGGAIFVKYFLEYSPYLHLQVDWYRFAVYLTAVMVVICGLDVVFLPNEHSPSLQTQKIRQSPIRTSLQGDFYEREVVPKFNTILICTAALKFWSLAPFFKNALLVVFVMFMTSHYNQRYLLNKSFLDYCAIINNNRKVLTYIGKKLLIFPLLLIVWLTLIINQHNYWFLVFNLFGVILNSIVLTCVYLFQMQLKILDQRKLQNIEILTFVVFLAQLLVSYGVSL